LKYASAFAVSRSCGLSAISPAMRLISASHHLSFVVSTIVIALAKNNNCHGNHVVDPVYRDAAILEVIIGQRPRLFPSGPTGDLG
jgi:hypothetical protein